MNPILKVIVNILVNILGIATFFWVRYANRTDKIKEPSLKFWWNDNKDQLISILLIDVLLMSFVFMGGMKINFEKITNLPEWIQLTGDGVLFAFIGLIFALLGYEAYKKLVIDKK